MPEIPSRSHMPSIHLFSSERAGLSVSSRGFPPRSTVSSASAPSSAATAPISSPASLTLRPPSSTITSPACTPASSAGERLPSAVSTAPVPATSTPAVLTWMPTTWPPSASSRAKAVGPAAASARAISAVNIVFFIEILPSALESAFAWSAKNSMCGGGETNRGTF